MAVKYPTYTGAALLWVVASCGSGGAGGSNLQTYHCSSTAQVNEVCIEYSALSGSEIDSAQSTCELGLWGPGGCSRTGVLGGCQVIPNEVNWYYPGGMYSTAEDVIKECSMSGATFVAAQASSSS